MYGKQTVKITCGKPKKVLAETAGLLIDGFEYESKSGTLSVLISAADMQGTKGVIKLLY